jgi:acyl transferase domain-containing protein/thioesterase domain-containing protein/acyl carrier protein
LSRSKTHIGIHDNFFDLGGNSLSIIHVSQQLKTGFKKDIPVVMLFRYPTVHTLADYLAADGAVIKTGKKQRAEKQNQAGSDIAVIGIAGRFPGAQDPHEFWNNLENNVVESIAFFSHDEILETGENAPVLTGPGYVRSGPFMQGREYFDASYFGYTPNEAQLMDPQMRIFHECTVEALEDAGYDPGSFDGAIGLYAGASSGFYWQGISFLSGRAAQLGTFAAINLVDKDFLCTRVSYNLNLKGPASMVQTACSTSLVAVHQGCQALLNGECDIALAGGVSISAEPNRGYVYREGMILSPDGHCRAFDANAGGAAFNDGAGIVVLKPLEKAVDDCDYIYAVIKGSAVNNDGSRKVGYTAPSIDGQAEVIRRARQMAGIDPVSITYIEAHGTGTPLGDPVEIEALKLAFNTQKRGFCAIGSVKTNIGHLDAAAGAAGLIKTVLALKYKQIPPSLHFETPNPKIDFENSPFYVNTKLKNWDADGYPLRAGVSSFGIGGTNAHVVLEQAPIIGHSSSVGGEKRKEKKYQLMLLSAKTESALEKMTENLANHLKENPGINLADVAYTLQKGRGVHTCRRTAVCSGVDEALETLTAPRANETRVESAVCRLENPPVIFMFPGQGAQYAGMGRELYEQEPVFRKKIDRCIEILQDQTKTKVLWGSRGRFFKRAPWPPEANLNQTEIAQPVIFIFQYALAKLLVSRGIEPAAMIGHSIGEYTAACISGVFSLEDALNLVGERGKLMQRMPGGAMLSVPLPEQELKTLLNKNAADDLSLAAVNSSSRCVVSGSYGAVEAFERKLKQQGFQVRRLHTSHAFHSAMMDPILEEFQQTAARFKRNRPRVPYISNLHGSWITGQEAADPVYWPAHLRRTVRFADGISELLKKTNAVFVEIGPGNVLSTFLKQHREYDRKQGPPVLNLVRHPREEVSDEYYFLRQMGKLWLLGARIDWDAFHRGEKRYRIPLPTYPFERHRYWNDSDPFAHSPGRTGSKDLLLKKTDPGDWFYVPTWERSLPAPTSPVTSPGTDPAKPNESPWLIFNDACGIGPRLKQLLEKEKREAVIVTPGSTYSRKNQWNYTLDPGRGEDYHTLFRELKRSGDIPGTIVHLWGVTGGSTGAPNLENIDKTLDSGFFGLLNIARAVGGEGITDELQLAVVSDNMQEVTGEEELAPGKAPVLAAVKIIPLEYPNIRCSSIDLAVPGPGSRKETLLTNHVNRLAAEIDAGLPHPVVAFRGTHRWLENFKPFRLDRAPAPNPRLKEKGVYLITGGMGAIGMSLAKHLAEKYRARLILVGRSPFPSRGKWNEFLVPGEDTPDTIGTKVRDLLEMENAGAEIMAAGADVSDPDQMSAVISAARERFGRIDGVIHSAGIADYGGIIQQRTRASIEAVMAAKIRGTLVLDTLLQDTPPDFIMLFSSLGNVLYKIKFGQVGYNAANEFSEAFAPYKTRRDGVFTMTINWTDWMEKGITVNAIKRKQAGDAENLDMESLLYGGLTTAEGIDVFDRVLAGPLQRVSVCTQDLDALCRQIDREQEKAFKDTKPPEMLHQRPEISTGYTKPRDKTEQTLVELWRQLFGIREIGIHDDFYELGGDSLSAVQLVMRINQTFDIKLSSHILLQVKTVAGLARMIETSAPGAPTSSLIIEIQPGESTAIPILLVHPIGGHVYFYRDLAETLGGRHPVYGIQARGLEGNEGPFENMREMAAHYIKTIRDLYPRGPYILGGASFGGMAAFEMARQFKIHHQETALLFMIDTPGPGRLFDELKDDASILAYLLNVTQKDFAVTAEQIRRMDEETRWKFLMEHVKITGKEEPEAFKNQVRKLLGIYHAHARAMYSYAAEPYDGRVLYFRAAQPGPYNAKDPEKVWGPLVKGELIIHPVPGHFYICRCNRLILKTLCGWKGKMFTYLQAAFNMI